MMLLLHHILLKLSRGLIFRLQLCKCNHLSRQERIPAALYTREKIMDYCIAVDEVKHII